MNIVNLSIIINVKYMLQDKFGRVADYLRIGVTDRCNLRCRYCMPEQGIDFAARKDILTYEEIIRLCHSFKELGVSKIRLTGGEPFVRKDIGKLIEELSEIFPSVHITTNATLLHDYFDLLKQVDITGLNISIDSLDRDKFFMITRRDDYNIVMQNILRCKEEGIPFKLNVVVMKGVNDMEIIDFVNFGITHNIEVRFIEAMPFNEDDGNRDVYLSADAIHQQIKGAFPSITISEDTNISSSNKYNIDGKHKIGIIPAYSRSLCGMCNRIRLTPKGEFLTCLYAISGLDLRYLVRDGSCNNEDIKKAILEAVHHKRKDGFEEESLRNQDVFTSMTSIGG